ncbi:MAG TPA: hypothetical protein VD997_18150 [Phycisphaerales bacterium]|nr:hypothetical protein [Phycisphaerales bacterium]
MTPPEASRFAPLDRAISTYTTALLKRGFAPVSQFEDMDRGYAERTYMLDHIVLKAIYERGLAYLEIGCSDEPDRMVEASGFRDLLDPPAQGHWSLGMGGAAAFIDAHWDTVYDLLRPSNWPQARARILGFRRHLAQGGQ